MDINEIRARIAPDRFARLLGIEVLEASRERALTCVNAQTSISYIRAGRTGPLRAESRMINAGRKLVTCEVRVLDADGELLALATVTGYVMTPRPAA